ncbi:MAG: hypothetical protein LQ337_000876 [Flavoplaca oasis]|nr:MAG: hypothetical protein LQ337_000876 [Flavoplaca oasis]
MTRINRYSIQFVDLAVINTNASVNVSVSVSVIWSLHEVSSPVLSLVEHFVSLELEFDLDLMPAIGPLMTRKAFLPFPNRASSFQSKSEGNLARYNALEEAGLKTRQATSSTTFGLLSRQKETLHDLAASLSGKPKKPYIWPFALYLFRYIF